MRFGFFTANAMIPCHRHEVLSRSVHGCSYVPAD
jgi:hypothetical protein